MTSPPYHPATPPAGRPADGRPHAGVEATQADFAALRQRLTATPAPDQ
ncbi:hypothetical protein ABZY81_39330 [Streptomyces sp. NPDC006514]